MLQESLSGSSSRAFQTGYNPRASGGAGLPPGLPPGALPLDPIGALKRTPGPHAVRRPTGFALSGYWTIALPVTLLDPPLNNNIGLSWEPNVVLHETNGTGKRISSAFISCQIMPSSAWKWQNERLTTFGKWLTKSNSDVRHIIGLRKHAKLIVGLS